MFAPIERDFRGESVSRAYFECSRLKLTEYGCITAKAYEVGT
jgi:hypothetical protein